MAVAELGLKIESQQAETAERRLKSMAGAADSAEDASDKLSKTSTRLARSLGGAVTQLAAMAAAAFSIRAVFRTLSEFETSMSGVQAVTRATADEMVQLRDIAKELGATTEYTAGQVADGLRFLGMAGFTTAESLEAIPAVLDLATAASMGLADAADISSNMMSAFGIEASRAAEVADVLASAASRANTDVRQMGEGMKFVGPVAAAMGISINDTAAAIGVLSDAGIQGGMAGTGLRRILSSLANPTTNAARAIRGLGLTVDQVNPSTNDLVDIVNRLSDAGIDAASALEIFGDRGGPALLALVENNAKLAELTDTLTDVGGAAKTMADIMRDNLGGDFNNLTSAAEGLIIALGEAGLTAAIRAVIQAVTFLIRGVTSLIEAIVDYKGQVIAAALAMTAYFLPGIVSTIAAMGAAVATTAAWIASLITLRGVLIATGIGAFIVLAGSLINAFLKLIEKTGSFGNALKLLADVAVEVFGRIKDAFDLVPLAIKAGASSMKAWFLEALQSMLQGFQDLTWSVAEGLNDLFGTSLSGARIGAITGDAPLSVAIRDALHDRSNASAEMRDIASNLSSPLTSLQALSDAMTEASDEADNTSESVEALIETLNGIPSGGSGGGGGGGGRGVGDEQQTRISALIESLQTERETIAQWYAQAQLDLIQASDAELEIIGGRNEAKLRLEQEYQERMAAIRGAYQGSALDQTQTFMGEMASALQSGNERMQKIGAVFASVEALINAYRAYNQVLANPTLPWFAKIPAAVSVLAAGMRTVASIKALGGGGGASASGGGGASSVPQQQQAAPPRQTRAIIQAVGGRSRFTVDEINDIISGIQKESKDGVIIEGFVT